MAKLKLSQASYRLRYCLFAKASRLEYWHDHSRISEFFASQVSSSWWEIHCRIRCFEIHASESHPESTSLASSRKPKALSRQWRRLSFTYQVVSATVRQQGECFLNKFTLDAIEATHSRLYGRVLFRSYMRCSRTAVLWSFCINITFMIAISGILRVGYLSWSRLNEEDIRHFISNAMTRRIFTCLISWWRTLLTYS